METQYARGRFPPSRLPAALISGRSWPERSQQCSRSRLVRRSLGLPGGDPLETRTVSGRIPSWLQRAVHWRTGGYPGSLRWRSDARQPRRRIPGVRRAGRSDRRRAERPGRGRSGSARPRASTLTTRSRAGTCVGVSGHTSRSAVTWQPGRVPRPAAAVRVQDRASAATRGPGRPLEP